MNKGLLRTAVGIALGLFAVAMPGYSAQFLAFSTNTAGGSVVISGDSSSETLQSLSNVIFNTLNISGGNGYTGDNGSWSITGSNLTYNTTTYTFTLNGTIGTCSGCSGGNLTGVTGALETFKVASMGYNTGANPGNANNSGFYTTLAGQSSLTLAFGTPTTLTEASALLTDLGFPIANSTLTSGGVISNTAATGSNPYTFTPTSETLNVTLVATPEPVSCVLLGSGLLGLAWFGRRRSIPN
jgi:hypothetical protein